MADATARVESPGAITKGSEVGAPGRHNRARAAHSSLAFSGEKYMPGSSKYGRAGKGPALPSVIRPLARGAVPRGKVYAVPPCALRAACSMPGHRQQQVNGCGTTSPNRAHQALAPATLTGENPRHDGECRRGAAGHAHVVPAAGPS